MGNEMSTRCQVQVIEEPGIWGEKITLYHHRDGYPANMIPTFQNALKEAREYLNHQYTWFKPSHAHSTLGRAGVVAAFLCRHDPTGFEPEEGHGLHGDIEYYYKLYVMDSSPALAGAAQWEVEVYTPPFSGEPTIKRCQLHVALAAIEKASVEEE